MADDALHVTVTPGPCPWGFNTANRQPTTAESIAHALCMAEANVTNLAGEMYQAARNWLDELWQKFLELLQSSGLGPLAQWLEAQASALLAFIQAHSTEVVFVSIGTLFALGWWLELPALSVIGGLGAGWEAFKWLSATSDAAREILGNPIVKAVGAVALASVLLPALTGGAAAAAVGHKRRRRK